MIVCRTRAGLARGLAELRAANGGSGASGAAGSSRPLRGLALVPTMGFLHEGHLSLVDRAREEADEVAVSIFVNPLQFGPGEDLDDYPRDEDRDLALLEERGVGLAFVPDVREMYPAGDPLVTVDPGPLADVLCGAYRPGHFRGVLTVVARLFGLFRPDVAVFGRKDYQQRVLIERMVRDLEMGVEIVTGPLVREEDGLAMSSRNSLLGPEERRQAVGLGAALRETRERFRGGERDGEALAEGLRRAVEAHPLLECQYAEVVHPETLRRVEVAEEGSVAAVAAFCGGTRLIDNEVLE